MTLTETTPHAAAPGASVQSAAVDAVMDSIRSQVRPDQAPERMLPAAAYTSPEALTWERRNLFAGTWTCLGRVEEVLAAGNGKPMTHRALMVGDVQVLLARDTGRTDKGGLRLFANTCRHRGHELLPNDQSSTRATILCPYHAWTFNLDGSLRAAPGFRDLEGFDSEQFGLIELPVELWGGWVFAHALHPLGSPEVPDFRTHLGDLARLVEPYRTGELVLAGRHSYDIAANWKVIAENYHECYHCPLIHPELCQVSPPDSGDNYDLPGAWIGGAMNLREGMQTMTLTGELAATPIPGVDPTRVEYLHLLPNLLISSHPDYVMTHRIVPLTPGTTWVECSWFVLPPEDGSAPSAERAMEFWDITNKEDWGACESVQRGLASPHFAPGPFAPNEDAVAQLVTTMSRAYHGRSIT